MKMRYKRKGKRLIVPKCPECKKIKNSEHHYLCEDCWEKFKEKKLIQKMKGGKNKNGEEN